MSASVPEAAGPGGPEPAIPAGPSGARDGVQGAAVMEAKAQAENFPVALRFLPRQVRADLAAFYVFARYVDDLGDEFDGDRVLALKEVDTDLARLGRGAAPTLAPVRGLARLTEAGRVPVEPFHALVAANLMDQHKTRYATFAELVAYCRLSANPVGQVVLHLAGQATAENIADSDAVCTGLQIVEHIQDVAEDFRAGRSYLPREDLIAFGVQENQLSRPGSTEDLKALLRWEAGRAAVMLSKGVPLTRRLRGWARPAVIGYVAGGRAALAALRRIDFDVLANTASPTTVDTLRAAGGVLLGRKR
ncbi:MAG TPA: squalene synthase HpnC [Actinocrinis sp.]|nr:squalene synthase HpnC [Actinocrinis sp.]